MAALIAPLNLLASTLADQIPLRDHATDQGPILGLGVAAAISAIEARRKDAESGGLEVASLQSYSQASA